MCRPFREAVSCFTSLHDVSTWELDPDVVGLGRRAKDWLVEPKTRRYVLFKHPRYHDTEATAEKAAAEIGPLLDVPTAETDLAVRNGQLGIISYSFVGATDELADGGELIIGRYPTYDRHRGREHSFQLLREVLEPKGLLRDMIKLLMFDAVIANSDRHQDNWSVIFSTTEHTARLAPSYDHGSSLGSHIAPEHVGRYLQAEQLNRYATRGKSRVGWSSGSAVKQLRHCELLRRIWQDLPTLVEPIANTVLAADHVQIEMVFAQIPDQCAPPERRELMGRIIRRRLELLEAAFQ